MLSVTPDTVERPDPAALKALARSIPLRDARHLFIGALVSPFAVGVLAHACALPGGPFYALVLASALTTAAAPVLALAYCADAVRQLRSSADEPDALAARCRWKHRWTRIAALSLFLVAAALNLLLLWPVGTLALGFFLFDPDLVPVLRYAAVAGLCGLVWADAVLMRP